ncbi:MAG TPA: carboxypeptidase-like regulatory domain-containing protein, partial [Ignavibacteria bacterium]
MKSLIIITLVLFSITTFSQEKGSISGKITDHETNQPVSDAIIEVIELKKTTSSNPNGEFEFNELPYGNYQLKVTSLGYKSLTQTDVV